MTSQEANSIPLGDILSHYGYEPSRRYGGYDMYRSPFRSDTSPSFKVFREENVICNFTSRKMENVNTALFRGCLSLPAQKDRHHYDNNEPIF